jgi:hypothetical protein
VLAAERCPRMSPMVLRAVPFSRRWTASECLMMQTFSIAGNGYSIVIEFKNGFPFAQIFAPKDKEFIAIEPMTAATNALCSGEGLRVIAPGEQFTAPFRIKVYHHA